jgi:hypothetical protein
MIAGMSTHIERNSGPGSPAISAEPPGRTDLIFEK